MRRGRLDGRKQAARRRRLQYRLPWPAGLGRGGQGQLRGGARREAAFGKDRTEKDKVQGLHAQPRHARAEPQRYPMTGGVPPKCRARGGDGVTAGAFELPDGPADHGACCPLLEADTSAAARTAISSRRRFRRGRARRGAGGSSACGSEVDEAPPAGSRHGERPVAIRSTQPGQPASLTSARRSGKPELGAQAAGGERSSAMRPP